jgi:hypothetical protein
VRLSVAFCVRARVRVLHRVCPLCALWVIGVRGGCGMGWFRWGPPWVYW